MKRSDSISYDGIRIKDQHTIKRTKKVNSIIETIVKYKITFLRAPPYTGKTSIGQLIEQQLKEIYQDSYIRRISWISDIDFDKLWKLNTGAPFFDWIRISKFKDVFLIMDECQSIFEGDWGKMVWPSIKSAEGTIHFVIIASYGESNVKTILSTPVDLSSSKKSELDINSLLFDREEFEEMVTTYSEEFPLTAKDWIFENTGGHVGLIKRTLDLIQGEFAEKMQLANNISKKESLELLIMKYLLSEHFTIQISKSRASPEISLFSDEEKQILDSVTYGSYIYSKENLPLQKLLKFGYLTRDNDNIVFPSPLYRRCYFTERYHSNKIRTFIVEPTDDGFVLLLENCIKNFRPHQMSSEYSRHTSLGVKTTQHLEVVWQMEFYRTATEVIGPTFIAPSVGRAFKSNGFLDFYIDSKYKWAFEFTSEGSNRKEHLDRFNPKSGIYKNLLPMINKWAVIDFKSQSSVKNPRITYDNLWVVLYSSDFTQYQIHRAAVQPYYIKTTVGQTTIKMDVDS